MISLSIFKNITNWFFKPIEKPITHPEPVVRDVIRDVVINGNLQYAFSCSEHDFYEFIDSKDMPNARAFAAMEFIEQYNQRTNREFLELLYETIIEACNKGRLNDVLEITRLAQNKLNHIIEPEVAYKLATAYFLLKDEDPYSYNSELGDKKIAIWKQHDKLGFFLREPVRKLLGCLTILAEQMPELIVGAAIANRLMLESIGQLRSFANVNSDLQQKLLLLKQTYLDLESYSD